MPASTITPAVTYSHFDGLLFVLGTIAWSAGPDTYTNGGGNTLNFNLANVKATKKPLAVFFFCQSGFVYQYVPGTDASNGTVKILTGAAAQAALTELANGAIPAGVSGDTIGFLAIFSGMV